MNIVLAKLRHLIRKALETGQKVSVPGEPVQKDAVNSVNNMGNLGFTQIEGSRKVKYVAKLPFEQGRMDIKDLPSYDEIESFSSENIKSVKSLTKHICDQIFPFTNKSGRNEGVEWVAKESRPKLYKVDKNTGDKDGVAIYVKPKNSQDASRSNGYVIVTGSVAYAKFQAYEQNDDGTFSPTNDVLVYVNNSSFQKSQVNLSIDNVNNHSDMNEEGDISREYCEGIFTTQNIGVSSSANYFAGASGKIERAFADYKFLKGKAKDFVKFLNDDQVDISLTKTRFKIKQNLELELSNFLVEQGMTLQEVNAQKDAVHDVITSCTNALVAECVAEAHGMTGEEVTHQAAQKVDKLSQYADAIDEKIDNGENFDDIISQYVIPFSRVNRQNGKNKTQTRGTSKPSFNQLIAYFSGVMNPEDIKIGGVNFTVDELESALQKAASEK